MKKEETRSVHRLFVGKDVHKFSAAHMTVFPDGTKEPLHGHNFQVSLAVDLLGDDPDLLDFGVLKAALQEQCDAWRDRLLLPAQSKHLVLAPNALNGEVDFRLCGKRYVVPADEVLLLPLKNIVTESLARHFARCLIERLGPLLRSDLVEGLHVTVSESAGQGATYHAVLP
jgi:6-pyruvoyltetrahydropterin/6-carboxytetrahydropterin synthase